MPTMLGFIALVAVVSHLAPYLTRREIFFGVTVSPGFRDSAAASTMSRHYAAKVWLLALAAAAFVATSPMPIVSGPMLLAQTIGGAFAYSTAWSGVRRHAVPQATIREAAIGPRDSLPGGLIGQLGPFILLVAAASYVAVNWESVPARFPTHWNLSGKPDGWTAKSVGGVFRGFAVGLIACTMIWFTQYAVLRWTRLPRVSGQEGDSHRRVRWVNLVTLLATSYLVAILLSWTGVVAMFANDPKALRLPLAIRVAPFALIAIGMLGVRIMRRLSLPDGAPIGDTTPDSSWIFGHLYFNRADPTLFVERRLGLGYTLNLGNPWSWVVMIVFVTALAIPLVLL